MDEFLIGDILLRWSSDGYSLNRGSYMEQFRYNGEWHGNVIDMHGHEEDIQPYTMHTCLDRNKVYDRYSVFGETLLIYHWGYLRNGFAIWPERVGKQRNICMFDPKLKTQPPVNADWFFGVSGLHAALLSHNAPILHASYVAYMGKAILFTAPSQTGKSTQASLWQTYSEGRIINGDRVLLRQREGRWHAYGFPCCGSSDICIDCTLPVAAIVVLEQGKENVVSEMSVPQKIRALVSGTEVHLWDMTQIDQAINLATQIAVRIPIVKFSCTPEEDAVKTLRQYLEENKYATSF